MNVDIFKSNFQIELPIAVNGVFWNGRPDEFSNISGSLDYSQEFGLTPYAKKGVYGYYNGQPRGHNGHDFAGALGTPLVAPCRCWCSFVGWDPDGYGNYCFIETETKTVNGDNIKMEFVLAHMKEKPTAVANKWYNEGQQLGLMGSTGMSTGPHTHFGGRPLVVKNGKTEWAVDDQAARGYVDLTDFFITKPIYNKQILINQRMELIKKEGDNNIYAIDPKGRACLILNWTTYQLGLASGMWEDEHKMVKQLPELGPVIILSPNN
jgi:murein DD-endopeptidase MepM/ murein hydrolase activator NlpD